jgi:hypothetical protein
MLGDELGNNGLVHRVLGLLLSIADVDAGRLQTTVSMSVAELHNDVLYDLLSSTPANSGAGHKKAAQAPGMVEIRSAGGDSVYVQGLSAWTVGTLNEASVLLGKSPKLRSPSKSGGTNTDHNEDHVFPILRSHYIYSIEVWQSGLYFSEIR